MKEIYADLTQDFVFKKAFASEQPERLKRNVFDRLFTLIKICNFSPYGAG